MNHVSLTGNLVSDPKLKHAGDERAICELRIAVDNGAHPTTFIDVRAFDGQAYACAEFLSKGRKVGVDGKLALDEWRGSDGRARHRYSVIGRVEFLDRPRGEEPHDPVVEPSPDGDAEPALALAA